MYICGLNACNLDWSVMRIYLGLIESFQRRTLPERGYLVGYAALIAAFDLHVPLPYRLALISEKHRKYETEAWRVLTPRHQPENTLKGLVLDWPTNVLTL